MIPILPLRRAVRCTRRLLPPLNYITLHYAYFISVCLITSVIFWGAATPFRSVSYTDSLFFTISAMTLAGLNTVNLSTLNTFQQFLLFLLIMLGSTVLLSSAVLHIRLKAFEAKFENVVSSRRSRGFSFSSRLSFALPIAKQEKVTTGAETRKVVPKRPGLFHHVPPSSPRSRSSIVGQEQKQPPEGFQTQSLGDELRPAISARRTSEDDERGRITFSPSAKPAPQGRSSEDRGNPSTNPSTPRNVNGGGSQGQANTDEKDRLAQSQSFKSFKIGRNSTFHDLTEAQRETLGGVEYRATTFLWIIVPVYFVLWQLLGCLGVGAYVANNKASVTRRNGINPWWAGAFFAVSAFNNSGMSLVDANMTVFQSSYYMIITMGLLILAGNTCYPIFLRFIIWIFRALLPDNERYREYRDTLKFLLDHPRRCYTNLFPSAQTWWLVLSVVLLNGINWVAFIVLDIGNPALKDLPTGTRVIDGLFQAFAVRSGGFYIVNITSLRIGLQVLYVVMMYISVYPVAITMRNSNVYEERSLGIYSGDIDEDQESRRSSLGSLKKRVTASSAPHKRYFVQQQLRAQLADDLWWIVLAVLLITIVETSQFERDPTTYSVFNIIFETVSAYGCVGISTGLPDQMYSFSGGWHTLSKLILCAVMIRGRHRGLPVAIDRAVLLPGEHLAEAEEEDAQIRLQRSMTINRSRVEPV